MLGRVGQPRTLERGRLVERTDVNVFESQAVVFRLIHRSDLISKQRSVLISSAF